MIANLKEVKERLEKESVVDEVVQYGDDFVAVNEKYFIYDKETGESDLYYIKVDIKDGRYDIDTCFCGGEFLELYDNQEKYIKAVISSMNEDLDNLNQKKELSDSSSVPLCELEGMISFALNINEKYRFVEEIEMEGAYSTHFLNKN